MVRRLSDGYTRACDNCKNIFSYDDEDIEKRNGARFQYYHKVSRSIKCPCCGYRNYIDTVNEFYDDKAYGDWKREQDMKYFGIWRD